MASTGFLVTTGGLASAATANPGGPYIHITQFRVGSAVNYTPTGYVEGVSPTTQTGLQGTTLYTSAPVGNTVIDADTIEVTLLIPSSTSSFNFGEIGIYLDTGVLFAICVFDTLQRHERAVGNQAGTNWKIRARLRLTQIPAICNVTLLVSQSLLEVPDWQSLLRPADQPTGANAVIVHDDNSSNDPVLVIRDGASDWGLVAYKNIWSMTLPGSGVATLTATSFNHPDISSLNLEMPQTLSKYVVKFPGGQMRKITNKTDADTITWTPAISPVPTSGSLQIFEEHAPSTRINWADTLEYNRMILDINPYWTTPTGTFPTDNRGLNQTALPSISGRRTTLEDWQLVYDAVRTLCRIHGVSLSGISTTIEDFVYNPAGSQPRGMNNLMLAWNGLEAKVTEQASNFLNFDAAYQEAIGFPVQQYSSYFATRDFDFTFNFTDDNHRKAMLNGGMFFSLTLGVNSPVDPSWVQMSALFDQIGTIRFYDGEVSITGPGNGTLNVHAGTSGFHRLNPTFRSQLTITHASSGWRVTIIARLVSEDLLVRVTIDDTISPGVYTGSPGQVTFSWTVTRPSGVYLNTPALAFPTMTFTSA